MLNRINLSILFFLLVLSACTKTEETTEVITNTPKNYDDVSTVKVENYINRIYIDLLGREPLNTERIRDVSFLRAGKLSFVTRGELITRLMTDTTFVVGDSSYKRGYYQRIYDLTKARLLEGAGEDEFYSLVSNALFSVKAARLTGDSIAVFAALEIVNRCMNVVYSRRDYQTGKITIAEMYAYMLDNPIYDVINMNTLNFVNASFDNMFFRFPTRDEFDIAFDIIEKGKAGSLFGGFAGNKPEYCQMLVQSIEFHESMIKWCYLTLIGREPTTQETHNLLQDYFLTKDLQKVQKLILMTDEYAHF